MDNCSVRIGVSAGVKDQGFSFALTTPDRVYNLSAQTERERDEWIAVIERVLERPTTPQERNCKNYYCDKELIFLNICSSRKIGTKKNKHKFNKQIFSKVVVTYRSYIKRHSLNHHYT